MKLVIASILSLCVFSALAADPTTHPATSKDSKKPHKSLADKSGKKTPETTSTSTNTK